MLKKFPLPQWRTDAGHALRGVALASVFLLAGCDSPPWDPRTTSSVLILPAAVIVPAGLELKYAEEYAARQGDCEALFGIGANMGSYYSSPTALVIQHAAYADLRKGMLVVFLKTSGWRSAGVIIDEVKAGWYVAGRKGAKTALVTEDNVIGYVVTAFSSDNMPKRD